VPVEVLVEQDVHSDRLQQLFTKLLQHFNDLIALHAGKALQKIADGIARLQMVQQALRWHPSPNKSRDFLVEWLFF